MQAGLDSKSSARSSDEAECVQRSDADAIDSRFGQFAHRIQIHATGRFKLNGGRDLVATPHRLGQELWPKVVDENNVGITNEGNLKLFH